MKPVHGFGPVCARSARVLVLGSMPGAASLRARQYYAHPRNAFWRIIGEITGVAADAPYPARLDGLKAARIALWDVLAACVREGSLDSAIDAASMVPNNLRRFFAEHPRITHVFFNGTLAELAFRRHVQPGLGTHDLNLLRLPSTSPAHAGRSFEQKRLAWSAVSAALACATPDVRAPHLRDDAAAPASQDHGTLAATTSGGRN